MRSVGNYVLGAQIGSGASSDVFAAQHRFLGDPVAIKLLRADVAGAGAISEVVAEAAKLRAVQHPNVVRVLDVGRDEPSGRCYLVMEQVDGESLAARLDREARLPEDLARRLGAEIADGLAAVHAAGLVHRDLKPGNVMLDGARAKLVDFGIAKFLGGDAARETVRRVGTPAYMAPEQLAGGLISPAVDVWALGVVLFRAVTGTLPFEGFADGRCPQLVEDAPPASALAPVSPALDRLIARCLARDPGRRPPSMAAIARELRGEADGELAGARITEDAGPLLAAPPAPLPPPPAPYARPSPSPLLPQPTPPLPPALQAMPEPSRRRRPLVMAAAAVVASVIGVSAAALVTRGSGGAAPASPHVQATAEAAHPDPGSAAPDPRSAAPDPRPAAPDPRSAAPDPGSAAPDPRPAAPDPRPAAPDLRPAAPDPGSAAPDPRPSASSARPRPGRRATLSVDVRSSPSGAQIFLGARLLGTTPRRLELPGPATLTLRHRGYQPASVRAARPGPLDVRLVRSCAQPPCEDLH
jgi:hypothetical protein